VADMPRVPVSAENLRRLARCSADRWLPVRAPARAWDDLRLVGMKLIYLIVTRAVSLLGLSRRERWWKDAEILCCAISSLWLSARAVSRSLAFDVAGPGVAGAACGDGAGGAPGGDAADRHSRHDRALADDNVRADLALESSSSVLGASAEDRVGSAGNSSQTAPSGGRVGLRACRQSGAGTVW
jgi:hypothetical protein